MDIRQQVRAIIAEELKVPAEKVSPEDHFRSLPNVDSMRVLQIILQTEKAFDIEIEADVTFRIQTVGDFQDLVEQVCQQGAAAS